MAIDIGADAIDRGKIASAGYTWVDKNNPANATGTITSIEVWTPYDTESLTVGTFYTTNGNTLKCRDSETIGPITAGSKQTFSDLSVTVEVGDYIGCYFASGGLERDLSQHDGIWGVFGEYIDPNDETEYSFYSGDAISLYGTGTEAGVEEQLENDADDPIYGIAIPGPRYGQKLTISERIVTKLSFLLREYGSPNGDLYFGIYKVSDDSLIIEKLWGDLGDVPASDTWVEVEFDDPVNINEEVRIVARVTFGNSNDHIKIRYKNSDVKANEMQTRWQSDFWNDIEARDTAYKYTYTFPGPTTGFNKLVYTSEPPTPNAWNQVKRDEGSGYKKLLYT